MRRKNPVLESPRAGELYSSRLLRSLRTATGRFVGFSGVTRMPANSTHTDYDANLPAWLRARDVIAGEDAVKFGGEKYLPRLDSQTDDEYAAYKSRACFFNATGRTRDGFIGLLFRRDPEVKLPDKSAGVGSALHTFAADVDLMGTSLFTFCK